MRTAAVLSIAFVLFASTAFCEDKKIDWKPYAALVGGQAMDITATRIALSRGCVELNRGVYGQSPSTVRLIAVKAPIVAANWLAMRVLHKAGHSKAERIVGYLSGGIGIMAGSLNLSASCR